MKKKIFQILDRLLSILGQRRSVILLSFVVGLAAGLAAVILKNLVHLSHELIFTKLHITGVNIIYFALPMIGIFLTVLFVRFFVKDSISHGITRVLYAISRKESNLASHNTWSSMISSTLTVGFGGSVGMEAPIVMTGSAIGSNLARILKQNYRIRTLLMGCGAAGGIAAIFKAPIAAVVFVLEVLMFDMTVWSIIPLLISSVTAATVAYFLLGQGVEFSFTISDPFILRNLPYYILLGVICGFISLYFSRSALSVEARITKIKNPYQRVLIGGMLVGLLIYLIPPLFGEGYDSLRLLLGGDPSMLTEHSFFFPFRTNLGIFIAYLFLILFLKSYAMALTNGSGGVGGLFAPSLFLGGVAGYLVAILLQHIGLTDISDRNFALTGMAGIMSGVMHAPLTSIFLIAEITGGYQLFIPLIITSTLSYITIRSFQSHSIYHLRLAQQGDLITHDKDKTILTLMNIQDVIEKDFQPVQPEMRLGELVKVVSSSKRNLFPVIDPDGLLVGIVLLDDIRSVMFDTDMYNMITVESVMQVPPAYIYLSDNMESVMNKFEESHAWNLPVIDKGKYIGFISKSKVFSAYRNLLMEFSAE